MKRKILTFLLWFGIPILAIAGLEAGTYISDLVVTNPTGSDNYATADDHIRLLKSTIKNTFPNINGAVTLTDESLNNVAVLNAANTFTTTNTFTGGTSAGSMIAQGTRGIIGFFESDATADNGRWRFNAEGESFRFEVLNDAASTVNTFMQFDRTANVRDLIAFTSTALTWNANTLFTTANDGSGSGLDADLLDGNSSAAFALASHAHSAADITSGTLLVARGGTGTTTSTGTGSVVLSASPTLTGTTTAATLNATTLQQGGVGVSLSGHAHAATDITSGTLVIGRGGTGTTDGTTRNITGKAGVTKTLSSSAPSGGSDGDIWYRF
jgi:hypothetical protein